MKEVMSHKLMLTPFDINRRSVLFVDSSKLFRIGYMLGQWPDNVDLDHPKRLLLIHCGSISAKDRWKNMALIEVEALGIHFDVEHVSWYVKSMANLDVYINLWWCQFLTQRSWRT